MKKTKTQAFKKNKTNKKFFRNKGKGAIYLGHIPHGFYEDEMSSYFNQFGKVVSAVVARSKKTGRSKGYGFVEFADEEVAKIVAETMNNYFLYNRVLKCRYIPSEERKGKVFIKAFDSTNYPRKKNRITDVNNKRNAVKNLKEKEYRKKIQKKIDGFTKLCKEKGIDFTFQLQDSKAGECVTKSKTGINSGTSSESEGPTDDQVGVLEIDESDSEITFKTPPQVKKVIKKSVNSPLVTSKAGAKSKVAKKSKKKLNTVVKKKK